MKDKLTEEFLIGIKEIEKILLSLGFSPYSFEENGFAYFIQFKSNQNIVKFLFGPPEWGVEMMIYTIKGKFEFKDLLQIPAVIKWVKENRYKQDNERDVKNELLWFVELLKFSLPIIE